MPVPKRKVSRSRRDKRNANKGLSDIYFTHCANCQEAIMPHRACRMCGYYKGEKLMSTKVDRTEKRAEKKQATQSRKAPASEASDPIDAE